jgi:hypothetical protein
MGAAIMEYEVDGIVGNEPSNTIPKFYFVCIPMKPLDTPLKHMIPITFTGVVRDGVRFISLLQKVFQFEPVMFNRMPL